MATYKGGITQGYYGELGEAYGDVSKQRISWMVEQAAGHRMLDIGCNQGICSILLARAGKTVIGVDISPSAIAYAKAELAKELPESRERVKFFCGDFLKADFSGKIFDTIYICEVLEHLEDPQEFVNRARELLAPGGRLVVTVPFGINRFSGHKKTFYLTNLYDLFSGCFSVEKPKYFLKKGGGCWIGIVIKETSFEENPGIQLDTAAFADAEQAFHALEKKYLFRIDKGKELQAKLENIVAEQERIITSHEKLKTEIQMNSEHIKAAQQNRNTRYEALEKSKLGRIQLKYWECGSKVTFLWAGIKHILKTIPPLVALVKYLRGNKAGARQALRGKNRMPAQESQNEKV